MNFWLYVILYAIIGVPLVGYAVIQGRKLGLHLYEKYPFIKKFFDNYAENYGIGLIITVVTIVVALVARWFGFI